MTREVSRVAHAVPDASLVVAWHTPEQPGWEHAQTFLTSLRAGALRLTAPEHLKVEVIRVLQLGARDKRYTVEDGIGRVNTFLELPIMYVTNDLLFQDAFRLASSYLMALYDALYLALAQALEASFITADRRFFNLTQRRGIAGVAWYEDVAPRG